jgi:hypothetical protein
MLPLIIIYKNIIQANKSLSDILLLSIYYTMDLSQFKSSTVSTKSKTTKQSSNPISRSVLALKDWVYPPITTLRQQRMSQYKDLAIFAGAILAVACFEDKIKSFIEIDQDLVKMGMSGPAQF